MHWVQCDVIALPGAEAIDRLTLALGLVSTFVYHG